jgi:hypothetical protein
METLMTILSHDSQNKEKYEEKNQPRIYFLFLFLY